MERIRCPHCNAVNQDVEPTDSCWQCGKPLGAPAAPALVAETPSALPPASQAIMAQLPAQNTPTLEERVAARKAARKQTNPAVPVIVVALIIIVLLLVYFALHH